MIWAGALIKHYVLVHLIYDAPWGGMCIRETDVFTIVYVLVHSGTIHTKTLTIMHLVVF